MERCGRCVPFRAHSPAWPARSAHPAPNAVHSLATTPPAGGIVCWLVPAGPTCPCASGNEWSPPQTQRPRQLSPWAIDCASPVVPLSFIGPRQSVVEFGRGARPPGPRRHLRAAVDAGAAGRACAVGALPVGHGARGPAEGGADRLPGAPGYREQVDSGGQCRCGGRDAGAAIRAPAGNACGCGGPEGGGTAAARRSENTRGSGGAWQMPARLAEPHVSALWGAAFCGGRGVARARGGRSVAGVKRPETGHCMCLPPPPLPNTHTHTHTKAHPRLHSRGVTECEPCQRWLGSGCYGGQKAAIVSSGADISYFNLSHTTALPPPPPPLFRRSTGTVAWQQPGRCAEELAGEQSQDVCMAGTSSSVYLPPRCPHFSGSSPPPPHSHMPLHKNSQKCMALEVPTGKPTLLLILPPPPPNPTATLPGSPDRPCPPHPRAVVKNGFSFGC